MHIILGGTGRVGSGVVRALLARGQPVTVVTRDGAKRAAWERQGARVAVGDVNDVDVLTRIFRTGRRAFVLNPSADPAGDAPANERETASHIVEALARSDLEKVVVASTYGAQPGEGIGDLTVLYELEQGMRHTDLPTSVLRSAYYMSNWESSIETARADGMIVSFLPEDLALPMVAPSDIAQHAARLLLEASVPYEVQHIEGPAYYSPADVASALATQLGKPVRVEVIPPEQWRSALQSMGFSPVSAASMAAMTRTLLERRYEQPERPVRGETTLQVYLSELGRALPPRS